MFKTSEASTAPAPTSNSKISLQVPKSHEPRLELLPSSSIVSRRTRYVASGRVPSGSLTICAGDPGVGKSTLTNEIAARLSRGELPGDFKGVPAVSVIATAEDALAEVVKPRLVAAGADLDFVYILRMRADPLAGGLVLDPRTLKELRTLILAQKATLLVLDPLVAFLPGALDAHRDQQVRQVLAALAQMAEETGAAVVVVMHFNKGDCSDPLKRIGGSIGFVAAARSVLVCGRDPFDPTGRFRILANPKLSMDSKARSLRFRLEDHAINVGTERIHAPRVVWCGEAPELSASDLIVDRQPARRRASASEETRSIVIDELTKAGSMASRDLEALVQQRGGSSRTYDRVRKGLVQCDRVNNEWVSSLVRSVADSDTSPIGVLESADGETLLDDETTKNANLRVFLGADAAPQISEGNNEKVSVKDANSGEDSPSERVELEYHSLDCACSSCASPRSDQ